MDHDDYFRAAWTSLEPMRGLCELNSEAAKMDFIAVCIVKQSKYAVCVCEFVHACVCVTYNYRKTLK